MMRAKVGCFVLESAVFIRCDTFGKAVKVCPLSDFRWPTQGKAPHFEFGSANEQIESSLKGAELKFHLFLLASSLFKACLLIS